MGVGFMVHSSVAVHKHKKTGRTGKFDSDSRLLDSKKTTMKAKLHEGAVQAVKVCLGVKKTDRVFIITDKATNDIGVALAAVASGLTPNVKIEKLEHYGQRPFFSIPEGLEKGLKSFKPTVTIYAASGQKGEIKFRVPLLHDLLPGLNVRHAHMINITKEIMADGMRVDYSLVYKMSDKITKLVSNPRKIKGVTRLVPRVEKIEVTTKAGTNLVATFSKGLYWINSKGEYHRQGVWGNLPGGEVFTCPARVDGKMVVDGVLGDFFAKKYGKLKRTPVTIEIKNSRVVPGSVSSKNKTLQKELLQYLSSGKNSDRVGEFAIGTNIGLIRLIGNLLQDEKFPGIHIAFGDPDKKKTGANWKADSHVDGVLLNCTIKVDGKTIMKDGKFTI